MISYCFLIQMYFTGGTKIRLSNGIRPTEGRLEVFHNNAWGTVCSDHFDTIDAATVCKILGYNTRYAFVITSSAFDVHHDFQPFNSVIAIRDTRKHYLFLYPFFFLFL